MHINFSSGLCSFLLIFVLSALLSSCSSETEDRVLLDKETIIDTEGLQLSFEPPLLRHKRTASILLNIDGSWEVGPPWKDIKFSDGRRASLVVKALASNGQTWESSIIGGAYGQGDPSVEVRFWPDIPKGIAIQELQIFSSMSIECKRIVWHEYDNL